MIFVNQIARSQVYLLEVAIDILRWKLFRVDEFEVHALILQRMEEDGGKDTFRRLGLAFSYRFKPSIPLEKKSYTPCLKGIFGYIPFLEEVTCPITQYLCWFRGNVAQHVPRSRY